jgi:hypothetical protein
MAGASAANMSEENPPCMTISHILSQPNIESGKLEAGEITSDDVECSRAHQMVMPFATSNYKMETISLKLKEGCVIDKKCGGCKVKANVMWEILESAMNEA